MGRAGRWRVQGAAIVAAMILLASPARAGCSPEDIADAFIGTLSAAYVCKSVYENDASRYAAIALTAALSGVALSGSDTGKGQALVNQFCAEAQGNADQVVSKLNTIFGNAIAENVLGDLSKELAAVGAAADVVKCACKSEQSTVGLGSEVGSCLQEALCWGQEKLGMQSCGDCEVLPPVQATCAAINATCEKVHYMEWWRYPECQGIGGPGSIFSPSGKGVYQDQYDRYGVGMVETGDGTLVVTDPGAYACHTGSSYCTCPKPMVPHWQQVPNPGSGDSKYVFSCDCPKDTHPGALKSDGLSECLCDDTNQVAVFGFAPYGMCPPAACPAGQTRLGGDKNSPCVTPCSDKSQGMAFDGSCCNPAQMTNCGECCPPDTVPNVKTGSCEPRPKQPK
ncbi:MULTISPECIES: hypothetical protein [unclassified Bradyrhizobium]|uniref:hypothetical protein n=1 Tax=unclassified Bradyrhizobium TaxID=2631580 RepID=UPI0028EFF953|nr:MULTISPECIES: hypothetical protein [unclassified Bradyrhizobium]